MLKSEKAEALQRQMENTERQITSDLRQKMEKEPEERARDGGADPQLLRGRKDLASMQDVASRLQRQLTTMTPAQLSSQARYFQARPWESVDSPKGLPMVMLNPDFLNRTLPVDAIQLIIATFNYNRGIERGSLSITATRPPQSPRIWGYGG